MIRRELILAFTTIALILVCTVVAFILLFSGTTDNLEEIVDEFAPDFYALQNLTVQSSRMREQALSIFLQTQFPDDTQTEIEDVEIEDAFIQYQTFFQAYEDSHPDTSENLTQLEALGGQIYDASRALVMYGREHANSLDSAIVNSLKMELDSLENTFVQTLNAVTQEDFANLSVERQDAEHTEQLAYMLSLGLSIVALSIAVGLALVMSNRIVHPLKQLESAALRATGGQYDTEVYVNRRNELGTLANGFNDMMRAINQRDSDLRDLNQSLETRIEERTAALAQKAEEASVANRLKDEFLATMSHELRTPLNAIIGYIGIMQMMGDLDDENLSRMATMEHSANQLLALINDVLDLSRVESGQFIPEFQPVALSETAQQLASKFTIPAREKGVHLRVEVAETVPDTFITDSFALNKILFHLLDNALKFTNQGEINVTIAHDADGMTLTVSDTGIGIPADQYSAIFERFRQIDGSSSRAYGGTGLGLSIVHSLCKALHGTVDVESEIGKGSKFTVKLPQNSEMIAVIED